MTRLLSSVAGLVLGGAVLMGAPAFAGDAVRNHHVNYRDLDLSQPGDVATLETRVARAVKKVCRADTRDLQAQAGMGQCRATAMQRSSVQIAAARRAATQQLAAADGDEKTIVLE